ncbi:hypothetical protein M406DRAFT_268699 [Cryphonectria parasitica EP155]|uniref:Uncharacterized protein n=1 Tax=Cryphonectria parasitica (strain ATCC 38755 / EP155) TaxID=660469 RepID=A0A9P4XTH5_CRYP1|nr:uncharacterized protein M406DRAFT_268699 [Cryphonectria parasitica EP155]KAF3760613.1 hypothetical protein M406DRAFT_268699 [Cryphonectria parasitica EP155]
MADDGNNIDSGLFAIALSDSEDDTTAANGCQAGSGAKEGGGAAAPRDRTGQTEEEFQAMKASYRAKVEDGEIWKNVKMPSGQGRVPKHEGQEILHAVEELYFYRRYEEAVTFIGRVMQGAEGEEEGAGDGLDGDLRALLRTYETRCRVRLVSWGAT